MLLGEPRQTNYDLHFDLFGIPVRVNPAFFLLPLVFTLKVGDVVFTLIVAVVFFVSILVHELGHAFAFGYFGQRSRIVLYFMGGLAIPDTNPWQVGSRSRLSSGQQIMVSFAGPFFGFILAALVSLVLILLGGEVKPEMDGFMPYLEFNFANTSFANNEHLINLIYVAIIINVYLNLLNLVPVFPLDGGQIARELFVMNDPANGIRNALILSIVAGGVMAVVLLTAREPFGLLFALLAVSSYMSLQQYGSGGFGGRPW